MLVSIACPEGKSRTIDYRIGCDPPARTEDLNPNVLMMQAAKIDRETILLARCTAREKGRPFSAIGVSGLCCNIRRIRAGVEPARTSQGERYAMKPRLNFARRATDKPRSAYRECLTNAPNEVAPVVMSFLNCSQIELKCVSITCPI